MMPKLVRGIVTTSFWYIFAYLAYFGICWHTQTLPHSIFWYILACFGINLDTVNISVDQQTCW